MSDTTEAVIEEEDQVRENKKEKKEHFLSSDSHFGEQPVLRLSLCLRTWSPIDQTSN
jgi:hypothetical protein